LKKGKRKYFKFSLKAHSNIMKYLFKNVVCCHAKEKIDYCFFVELLDCIMQHMT
jgi:hypothetical protein